MQAAGADGNWLTEDVSTRNYSMIGNPIMFTGRWWHSRTGLYYYRFRDYDPEMGRFLQPDPLGYIDTMNLYAYCANNLVNWIDPLGWVIEHLLKTRLTPVDGEEMYEDLLDECYPEVRIGDSFFNPSRIIKELDPVCFNMGVTENLDNLVDDGRLYEYAGDYYDIDELDAMLTEIESE